MITEKDDCARVSGARRSVHLNPGRLVSHGSRRYRIESLVDFERAVCVDVELDTRAVLPLVELGAPPAQIENGVLAIDLADIDNETWKKAQQRYEVIQLFGLLIGLPHTAAIVVGSASNCAVTSLK